MDFAGKVLAIEERVALEIRHRIETIGPAATAAHYAAAAQQLTAGSRADPPTPAAAVEVIPVLGLMAYRSSWFGTATDRVEAAVRRAAADKEVSAILLDIYSPGGEVYGVAEAAAAVREARATKPVVAVANSLAASAAYWLASQATEVFVTPSGEAGSIGVYGMHVDMSGALEKMGLKVKLVFAGKYKVEGNPFEPLSGEAEQAMQESVDRYHRDFVGDVAKGRGVAVDAVRSGFGEGRVVGARKAVELRMANTVGSFADAHRRAASLGRAHRSEMAALAAAQVARVVLTT